MSVTVDANTIALYKFNNSGEIYNGAVDTALYGGVQRNASAVGTTAGVSYSTDGPGLIENGSYARSFPTGSNTYLQRSADTTMVSTFLASYTAECWINPSAISALQLIFTYGTSGESLATNVLFAWNIQATSGKQGISWEVDSLGTNAVATQSAGSGLSANTWQHIAVTVDNSAATATIKFYLNGVLQDTFTGVTKASGGTSSFTQIGANQNTGGTDYFHGAIKSFVIRDTAYTGSQIAADAAIADWEHVVDSGTVVAYQLNDPAPPGTGYTAAIDTAIYGGTRRNLAASGGAGSASSNLMHIINGPGGKVDGSYARWFPGTIASANAHLERAGDTTLAALFTGSYTAECWICVSSLSVAQVFASYAVTGETLATNCLFQWRILTSGLLELFWEFGSGTNVSATQTTGTGLTVGVWAHIAAVVDNSGATSTVKFYLNGALQQTISSLTKAAGGTSSTWTVGSNSAAGGLERFHGALKSLVVRNTAYTTNQIAADAALTTYEHVVDSGTVLAYQFNEPPDCPDETNYGYHLRRIGSLWRDDPLYPDEGYSAMFDTASEYDGHWGYTPLITMFTSGVWTFDCWIRLSANYDSTTRGFFLFGGDTGLDTAAENICRVGLDTARKVTIDEEYGAGVNSFITGNVALFSSATAYNRHHFALVHNGTTCTAYVDGVLVDTISTPNIVTGATQAWMRLGMGAALMSGNMDNARFKNVAMSATEILAAFNDGGASTPNYNPDLAGGARRSTRWGIK